MIPFNSVMADLVVNPILNRVNAAEAVPAQDLVRGGTNGVAPALNAM